MSVQNPDRQATKQDLKDFYDKIAPYLGGGGGGSTYTAGDGIDIDNDEISVDEMPSADMAEIVTPKPSTRRGYQKYSTDEQVIGEWIDGKPLYQKTLQGITSANALTTTVNLSGLSYDYITISNGSLKRNNGAFVPVQTNNNEVSFTAIVLATQNLYLKVSDDANNKDADYYVTIQYTKTTDV